MFIDLHRIQAVYDRAKIVREVACSDFELLGKLRFSVFCRNLIGGNATLNLCLIVIRNVGTVRKAMVIGAKLIGKPILVVADSPLPETVTSFVVIVVLLLKDFNAGNILLIARCIRICKGIVCDTCSVDHGLGNGLPCIADALRRVSRILISRYQCSHFYLPRHGILDVEPIAEPVFRIESQVIQVVRSKCFLVIILDGKIVLNFKRIVRIVKAERSLQLLGVGILRRSRAVLGNRVQHRRNIIGSERMIQDIVSQTYGCGSLY